MELCVRRASSSAPTPATRPKSTSLCAGIVSVWRPSCLVLLPLCLHRAPYQVEYFMSSESCPSCICTALFPAPAHRGLHQVDHFTCPNCLYFVTVRLVSRSGVRMYPLSGQACRVSKACPSYALPLCLSGLMHPSGAPWIVK